jgi:hypothetical protein
MKWYENVIVEVQGTSMVQTTRGERDLFEYLEVDARGP